MMFGYRRALHSRRTPRVAIDHEADRKEASVPSTFGRSVGRTFCECRSLRRIAHADAQGDTARDEARTSAWRSEAGGGCSQIDEGGPREVPRWVCADAVGARRHRG